MICRSCAYGLSKAFDCINAYGISIDSLKIFFSLKGRKENVQINNTYSVFQVLLSWVPQGSILGPILFNIFINDILIWIENVELQNFVNDNTIISCTEKPLKESIKNWTSESEKAVQWVKESTMIVNPDKLQAIIIDRKNLQNNPTSIKVNDININSENSVRPQGLGIDSKLHFHKHNTLLKKSDKCSMEVRRLRTMALEFFKNLNDLNLSFIKELFNKRNNVNRRKKDLIIHTRYTVKFWSNSLRCLGPYIWNTLPENIKEKTSFEKFKKSINSWYGPSCKWSLCHYQN